MTPFRFFFSFSFLTHIITYISALKVEAALTTPKITKKPSLDSITAAGAGAAAETGQNLVTPNLLAQEKFVQDDDDADDKVITFDAQKKACDNCSYLRGLVWRLDKQLRNAKVEKQLPMGKMAFAQVFDLGVDESKTDEFLNLEVGESAGTLVQRKC